jgi:zinc transporter 2
MCPFKDMSSSHTHEHNNHGVHCDGHEHSHDHSHSPPKSEAATEKERRNEVLKKLKTASILCFTFLLVEVVGGILAGSLAVLSDAAHLAADLSAFIVAIVGSHIASLPASDAHTFGLKRTESLAALFSMASLMVLSIGLAVEAVRRLYNIAATPGEDQAVDGKLMATIAFIGVVVNVILAFVLGEDHVHMPGADHNHDHDHSHESCHHHGHSHAHEEESALIISCANKNYSSDVQHIDEVLPTTNKPERNVNLHAAYLHVLADLAQSIVVLIAGLLIWWKPTWQIADPITTLIFSVLVSYSTIGPMRSSLSVLLEEVPPGVQWDEIYDAICQVSGVSNVHDLHIWSISQGQFILSLHATAEDLEQAYDDIKAICIKRKISHLTLQIQPVTVGGDCVTCTEGSVHMCR